MEPERIKILIYESYAHKIYGTVRYLLSIFKYIDRSRFEPLLVTSIDAEFLETIRDKGFRCIVQSTPNVLKKHGGQIMKKKIVYKLIAGLAIIRFSCGMFKLIMKEKPAIVQCNSIRALLTIGLAVKISRIPLLFYVNGHLDNTILDRIGFWLSDMILFQNKTNKNRKYPKLIRKYAHKIRVFPEGIDLDELLFAQNNVEKKLAEELAILPDRFNLVYMGVISPLKGVHYLLEAIVELKRELPDFMLYLVGDHAVNEYIGYKKQLERIIQSNGLEANVTFTGYRFDVIEILSMMDLAVLPSLSEGMPKAILEAMALGKPVVATRVGGVSELLINGVTGFIVEPKEPHSLAKAISTLARDKELRRRFGMESRRTAFEQYSIRDSIIKLEGLYLELTGNSIKYRKN